jgi:hypothetical protein
MTNRCCRLAASPWLPLVWLACLSWPIRLEAVQPADASEPTVSAKLRFQREILPLLADKCFACHGFDASSREADLRLDLREAATATREAGAAVIPGQPDNSQIILRIEAEDPDFVMPPPDTGKQLTAEEKLLLRRWIADGALYEKHWSFTRPQPSTPPTIAGVEHPIDRFIQGKLEEHRLSPAELADPATLIRRVSLDLIGLPPTLEEIDDFLLAVSRDPDAAYRALIERLLASPHYGERWGRWWLDQARYADSNGYSIDAPRQIWSYRDWVIESLNGDMPFDQFTIEQLAGDLLPSATDSQRIATGFHRNTQINQEGGIDKEQFRIDSVFDRVATTGTVWLGLTVGCAQCHDHKFDPISQREYYQLFAFFNNQDEPTLRVYDPSLDIAALKSELKSVQARMSKVLERRAEEMATWEAAITPELRKILSAEASKALKVPADKRSFEHRRLLFIAGIGSGDGSGESFRALNERYLELDGILNRGTTTLVMAEAEKPRVTHLLIKGDFTRPDEAVDPGTPSILHPLETGASAPNRLDLARWIVSRSNPLMARVIMNRVWQQYFGRGLVETENDFGFLGSQPTHPELLDWLALEWMDRGWSLKAMHRWIVSSRTYQQSSQLRPELQSADPHNYWLGRQSRLRLDAEIVRDVALTASGLLFPKVGGPPVFPPIPEGVMGQGQVKREWKVSSGADRYRRGLYTFLYRATPPPSLNVFDSPDGYSPCTRRNRSNTPLQSLTLMNDAAFVEFAVALQHSIENDGAAIAFRRCTGRWPKAEELAILAKVDPLTAARALLNLDETITRE